MAWAIPAWSVGLIGLDGTYDAKPLAPLQLVAEVIQLQDFVNPVDRLTISPSQCQGAIPTVEESPKCQTRESGLH